MQYPCTYNARWKAGLALFTVLSLSHAPITAAGNAATVLTFGSVAPHRAEILIEGTSTFKKWEVRGNTIQGIMKVYAPGDYRPPEGDPDADDIQAVLAMATNTATIVRSTAPLKSLASGNKRMDAEMFSTLNAEDHDTISYVLIKLEKQTDKPFDPVRAAAQRRLRLNAIGNLTISGQTREVSFPVTITPAERGLRITGQAALKMTDFGLTPPGALMGALRTGDDITVSFSWQPQLLETAIQTSGAE